MFILIRLRKTTIRTRRDIKSLVPLALPHIRITRGVDGVKSGGGIEG
jgi:hypothetical protein